MPVEITLPLTPLEQAVADARENERKCAVIVEDLKLQLKTAKATWEESVEEMKTAVDEMINDKKSPKQPGLFDDEADAGTKGGPDGPNSGPPADPAGQPAAEPTTVTIVPTSKSYPVTDYEPVDVVSHLPQLPAAAPAGEQIPVTGANGWQALVVAEQLDAPGHVLSTLARHSVVTVGDLANALKLGHTFGLADQEVSDLREVIEQASADDDEPILFGKSGESLLVHTVDSPLTGESIDVLNITAETLNAANASLRLAGHAIAEPPRYLPTVNVSDRLHVVVSHETGPNGDAWLLRPLWTESEFALRHPGKPNEETASQDKYLGLKVHLKKRGKNQDVFMMGSNFEERRLVKEREMSPPVEARSDDKPEPWEEEEEEKEGNAEDTETEAKEGASEGSESLDFSDL